VAGWSTPLGVYLAHCYTVCISLLCVMDVCTVLSQVITVQVKCFHEIISIGLMKYREYNLPLYRVLNWSVCNGHGIIGMCMF